MLITKCPICDALPGEPCYDPHGHLPYKDMHAARYEAERKIRLDNRDGNRPEVTSRNEGPKP